MPEGDTIHRSAHRLAAALTGATLTGARAPRVVTPLPVSGTRIDGVEARGKYLVIGFDDGTVLETHMKMSGSWHLYRPGERWRRSPATARVVLETADWLAVCFNAPHVVFRPALPGPGGRRAGGGDGTVRLGPDLCTPDVDLDEIVARFDRFGPPDRPLVDVLLDQRIFCGVGNVYKSEVLHACALHPDTPIDRLDGTVRRRVAEIAHRLLRANLGGGPRATWGGGLAVYRRAGSSCPRCGATVVRGLRGPHQRSTYWCEGCQHRPAPARPRSFPPGAMTPDP